MLNLADVAMQTVFSPGDESGSEGAVFCHHDGSVLSRQELLELWNMAVVGAAALGIKPALARIAAPPIIDV